MAKRNSEDRDVERMLAGRISPDDAAPGHAATARLMQAAAATTPAPANDELIVAMAAAVRTSPTQTVTPRRTRKPMLAQLLTAKALAAVAAVSLSATGAAAAAGVLPDAVQHPVADAAEQVGVELPENASDRAAAVRAAIENTQPGPDRGKAVSEAANNGADENRGDGEAEGDDNADAAETEAEARQADAEAKAEAGRANGDEGRANADRAADAGQAPVSTPNEGSADTGDEASDDTSSTGTDTAGDADDAGEAGDDNADNADERAPERPAAPRGR